MGVTTKKYVVSISSYRKLLIFRKTVGWHLWILREILYFWKTHKNSYTGSLSIANPENGGYKKIWSFSPFLPQIGDF
jgi:hypothetical protein